MVYVTSLLQSTISYRYLISLRIKVTHYLSSPSHGWYDIPVWRSSLFPYCLAGSDLTLSVMDGRSLLFHNMPLSSRFLHQYQLIMLGDRCTRVWTTCLRLLRSSARAGVEPATSQRFACGATVSPYLVITINDCGWLCSSIPSKIIHLEISFW